MKPTCFNCQRHGEVCDYSIRLNWEGRGKGKADGLHAELVGSAASDSTSELETRHTVTAAKRSIESLADLPCLPLPPGVGTHLPPQTGSSYPQSPQQTDAALVAPALAASSRSNKRIKYDSSDLRTSYDLHMPPPDSIPFQSLKEATQSPQTSTDPVSPYVSTPLTSISTPGDDSQAFYPTKPSPKTHNSDLSRLSVNSLLSGPPGMQNEQAPISKIDYPAHDDLQYQDTTIWGLDRGFSDLDIGNNDDMNAISGSSPVMPKAYVSPGPDIDRSSTPVEFGFGIHIPDVTFANESYYDKPVPICIPRALEPLPHKLLENPMNLLVSCSNLIWKLSRD